MSISIRTMIIIPAAVIAVLSLSCKSPEDEKAKQLREMGTVEFFSSAEPGKWKAFAGDHAPQYTVTFEKPKKNVKGDKGTRVIEVTVPFEGTEYPIHYTEVIVLLDHNQNEIQKKTFLRGNKKAKATFRLPGDYESFVFIVQKCNLHDMWMEQVSW